MSIHVALNHVTHYRYDRDVTLVRSLSACVPRHTAVPAYSATRSESSPVNTSSNGSRIRKPIIWRGWCARKRPASFASRLTSWSSFPFGRSWLEAVADLTTRIHAEFAYDAEATTVTTQVDEVLAQRRGVCQDFVHLMVSCLRSQGLPARHVNGYVLNQVGSGETALTGANASHAGIEAHCAGIGWAAFNPTNGKLADTEFITLGWGCEFFDVTPLHGVVLGASTEAPEVAVSVRKIAEPGQLSP